MLVNVDWLRDWVSVENDGPAVAEDLTMAGLEVDAVTPVSALGRDVVVVRIRNVQPHPSADRLTVCLVDDGSSEHEVVCGAPNVMNGIRVPFAPVGAVLPGGRTIEAVELRGVVSDGMLCSAKELALSEDGDGLMILEDGASLGASLVEYLRLDDSVLDIDLTPNRGDCFSVVGIARELAAHRGLELRPLDVAAVEPANKRTFRVQLAAGEACPRFAGRVISGVRNTSQSPLWLKERLRRAGLRAIDPIVDVTNYVMLELGQPLHAYDLDELRDKIVVRWAVDGENLRLLDGREIELADDVLVIADAEGAIGMAGIMGGDRTGVSADTRNVFLEAAHFSPSAIAGRPRRFGLHTDASVRFERGVDPEGPARAIERASKLLTDIAGGTVGPTDVNENLESVPRRKPVDLRHSRVQSVLGMALSPEQIEMCLGRLEMDHERLKEGWRVTPPSFRFDVTIEEDLVEEVGRIIGYDLIPTVVGHGAAHLGRAPEGRVPEERVADLLIDRGYNEVITYSFIDERLEEFVCPGQPPIRLLNPISADLGAMRRSLWPGLLLAAQRNLSNQLSDFRLFECGPQFADKPRIEHEQVLAGLATGARQAPHWDTKPVPVDFYDIKADIESVLDLTGNAVAFSFVAGEHPALMPGQTARIRRGDAPIGWVGALHPRLQLELDIKQPLFLFALRCEAAFESGIPVYSAYSRFPSIRRDIAIVVDERISAAELEEEVMKSAGPHLREVVIFDLYRGPGIDATRKSVGLGLILQNASRTLTDGDGESAVRSVTRHLERELGARIRT